MEGDLWKKSEYWRRWNERWFRLDGATLLWYGKHGDDKPKGQITITAGVIIATQDQKNSHNSKKDAPPPPPQQQQGRWPFSVTFKAGKYVLHLCAATKALRSEWIKVLSDAASGKASSSPRQQNNSISNQPQQSQPSQQLTRRNSRSRDHQGSTHNVFDNDNDTTLFRSLVRVLQSSPDARGSGSGGGLGGPWKELKATAVVRLLRNDSTGEHRCVVHERAVKASSNAASSTVLDQPVDPKCKIHRYGPGGEGARTTGWVVPRIPPDAPDSDTPAAAGPSSTTPTSSSSAAASSAAAALGGGGGGGMRRNMSFDSSQSASRRNRRLSRDGKRGGGGGGHGAVALLFVSPQLADQFAYEYERSRQHMKRVVFRRDLDARNRRQSRDRHQLLHQQRLASSSTLDGDGAVVTDLGSGTVRRGGGDKKAHSWDPSTYRYQKPGADFGGGAVGAGGGRDGGGVGEYAGTSAAAADNDASSTRWASAAAPAPAAAPANAGTGAARREFDVTPQQPPGKGGSTPTSASATPAPASAPPLRRVARLPGTVMVTTSTPAKSSAHSTGGGDSGGRGSGGRGSVGRGSGATYSLTSFSDSLPNHKASGDDLGHHVDPRVRAVASVKAEQMRAIHEANRQANTSQRRGVVGGGDTSPRADDEDVTTLKWENDALRHQVEALKHVLQEKNAAIQRLEQQLAAVTVDGE